MERKVGQVSSTSVCLTYVIGAAVLPTMIGITRSGCPRRVHGKVWNNNLVRGCEQPLRTWPRKP